MFLSYQLQYLLYLQHFREITNGFFDQFFLIITAFGEIIIPLILISLIYWSLNRKLGEFILLAHSFGLMICQFFKMIFCINRPWILNNEITPVKEAMKMARGYSFPSGHTECAMTVYGSIISNLWNNKILRYSLIILTALVVFSRNYLGVHTIQDVLFSIILGLIIIFIGRKIFNKSENNDCLNIKICLMGIFLIFLFGIIIWLKPAEQQSLYEKIRTYLAYYSSLGYSFSTIFGWYLSKKFVPFKTNTISNKTKILRFIFGIIILFFIYFILKDFLINSIGSIKGSAICSMITSFYITFLYPLFFYKIEKIFKK